MIDFCATSGCDKKVDRDGVCFRCRVATVGVSWVGGAHRGRSSFHETKGDYMREHYGVSYDKDLLRERPDIERSSS